MSDSDSFPGSATNDSHSGSGQVVIPRRSDFHIPILSGDMSSGSSSDAEEVISRPCTNMSFYAGLIERASEPRREKRKAILPMYLFQEVQRSENLPTLLQNKFAQK